MKLKLYLSVAVMVLTAGCNNSGDSDLHISRNDEISEANLPKGKYVIEEENTVRGIDNNPGSINDYKGNNTNDESGQAENSKNSYDDLKRRFKNLLVFHAEDTMKIKKAYLATLILGKDQVLGDLKAEVLESSNSVDGKIKQDATIDIGSKMRAKLIDMSGAGNKGFDIELIGGEEAATQRLTEKRKKVIWQWKLTPLTPGLQELKLSINIIEKDGETVNLPARNIPVIIFAEKEGFGAMMSGFFKNENTKWILSAVLIPVFIAWLTTRMRHKHDKRSSPAKPADQKDAQ
jgi:hypothetical protein